MEAFLQECDLHHGPQLWNADKTGFCTTIASQRVLARRYSREVHEIAGDSGMQGLCEQAQDTDIGSKHDQGGFPGKHFVHLRIM